MKRTQKEIKRSTEKWLDERWTIANREDVTPQDISFYNGALKVIEFLGYDWVRNEDGNHKLFN